MNLLLGAVLVVHAALAAASVPRLFEPRRVALVVGADAYDDEALPDLRFAAADADAMAAALGDPRLGDFEVHVLHGEVSAAAVLAAFETLTGDLVAQDTFVFYIASHGTLTLTDGTKLYLLLSDARLADPRGTGITVMALVDRLAHLPVRRTVMIFDACYNGQGRSRWAEDTSRLAIERRGTLDEPVHRPVDRFQARYYAAMIHQSARESAELGHGVYTHYFIEALTHPEVADLTGDHLVEAWEAHRHARVATMAATSDAQRPWAEQVEEGFGGVVLSGRPDGATPPRAGVLDDAGTMRGVRVDGVLLQGGAVAPGRRVVEWEGPDGILLRRHVRVRPGERISASTLLDQQKRWEAGIGTQVQLGAEYLPALATTITVDRVGLGGLPMAVGGELGLGIGAPPTAYEAFGPFSSTGSLAGTLSWMGRRRVASGVSTRLGAVWRAPEGLPIQVGPVLEAGPTLGLRGASSYVTIHPGAQLLFTETGLGIGAVLHLQGGVRWD